MAKQTAGASLVSRQEATLELMARPRTSQRRATRMQTRVLRDYRAEAARVGYSAAEIDQQVRDIRDMHALREAAE